MKKYILLAVILLSNVIYSQAPVFQDTKGQLSVSNSGTLNYEVPIALPPTGAGMQPNISLIYNSASGNGVAGYGWSISGLSSISHTNARLDLDGKIESSRGWLKDHNLSLDASGNINDAILMEKVLDKFTLNGKRLIVNNIKYISVRERTIEYQLESYSSLKIEMNYKYENDAECYQSDCPFGGPIVEFKITSPDGTISNYLNTFYWFYLIANAKDNKGNTIDYKYSNKNISEINWGSSSLNNIKFYYKNSARIEYLNNEVTNVVSDKILESIEVYSQGKLYKKYVLTHETIHGGYERIKQIQEFNEVGEGANPVIFSYRDTQNTISNSGYFNSSTQNQFKNIQLSGDFDGNGESDFIANNKLYLNALGNNNVWNPISFPAGFDATNNVVAVKTLDLEGKLNKNQTIAKFTGNKLEMYDKEKLVYTKTYNFDMRAGGPADEFGVIDNSGGGCRGESIDNAYSLLEGMKKDLTNTNYGKAYEGDFNGDGLSEVIYKRTDGGKVNLTGYKKTTGIWPFRTTEYECTTTPWSGKEFTYLLDVQPVSKQNTPNYKIINGLPIRPSSYVFDINGDGKDDLINIERTKELKVYNISLDNPESSITPIVINSGTKIDEFDTEKQLVWGDFNGDGKVELMIPEKKGSTKWFVYNYFKIGFSKIPYSNFIEYDPYFQGPATKNQLRINQYQAADMDKDGKSDFLVVQNRAICVTVAGDGICDIDGTTDINIYNNIGGSQLLPNYNYYYSKFDLSNPINFQIQNNTAYGATYSFTGDFRGNRYSNASNIAFIEASQIWKAKYNKDLTKDLTIAKVTEGVGIQTEITYSPMVPSTANNGLGSQNDFYYSANDELYPNAVVKELPTSNLVSQLKITGDGFTKKQDFKYYGLTLNSHGYGYFGFKKMARSSFYTDAEPEKFWTVTQTKPGFLGKAIKEWTYRGDNHDLFHNSPTTESQDANLLSLTEYNYNNGVELPTPIINQKTIKKLFPTQVVTKDFVTGVKSTTNTTYNEFFNPLVVTESNGIRNKTTTYSYFNNPTGVDKDYVIGRVTQKNESITAYGDTRTSEEKYTYTNNFLTQTQTKGNNTDYITENYLYDSEGNITQKSISAPGVSTRISKYEYDTTKRFVTKQTDPDNFSTQLEYNSIGQVTKSTDYLGTVTQNTYDSWGKLIQTTVTGDSKDTQTANTNYTRKENGGYVITKNNTNTGEEVSTELDIFGREIKQTTKGFKENTKLSTAMVYDFKGRKIKESEPYFETSAPSKWNNTEYDFLNRPTKQTLHTGKIVGMSYSGLSSTTTDGAKTSTITLDANGNKTRVQDNTETITYSYFANNQLKATNYGNFSINVEIDGWGRKTSMLDPQVSTLPYQYTYNNYGEMLTEVLPNGTNNYTYSPTGRLLTKVSKGKNTDANLTYTYNAKGFVTKQTGSSNQKNFTKDFVYNQYNELISQKETSPKLITTTSFEFDGQGRMAKETISASLATNSNINNGSPAVEYVYSSYNGMLTQLKESKTAKILWQLNETNEQLQATNYGLGNGMTVTNTYDAGYFLANTITKGNASTALELAYSFDNKKGTLNSRENKTLSWSESFTYDNLDRLTSWKDPKGTNSNTYDNYSRITENNEIGNYGYDATARYKKNEITLNPVGNTYYKTRNTQDIAYNSNQNPTQITETNKPTIEFLYDAEGNRTEATLWEKRRVPFRILKQKVVLKNLWYNADNSVEVENTLEKKGPLGIITKKQATYKFITYLAGSPYDAPMVYHKKYEGTRNLTNEEGIFYLHRDYLGSIQAISNSNGVTIERRQFDAWGNLTKLQVNNKETTDTNLMFTQRGYTGHEHFYQNGIIHMNGRIYDPKLRTFLSPDVNLLDPENSQHYNRYSYGLNNPLMYTDPSGNEVITLAALGTAALVGAIVGGISYSALACYYGNFSWNNLAKNVVTSAVTSAALATGMGLLSNLFNAGANAGGIVGALNQANDAALKFIGNSKLLTTASNIAQSNAGAILGYTAGNALVTAGQVANSASSSFGNTYNIGNRNYYNNGAGGDALHQIPPGGNSSSFGNGYDQIQTNFDVIGAGIDLVSFGARLPVRAANYLKNALNLGSKGGKTLSELQNIAKQNAPLFRQLFGTGKQGAESVLNNIDKVKIPKGLSKEAMKAYRELIKRVPDPTGTQAIRAKILDKLIK